MSSTPPPSSNKNNENESSGTSSSLPFFADATLDLDTAHDLAETPDVTQRSIVRIPPLQQLEHPQRQPQHQQGDTTDLGQASASSSTTNRDPPILPALQPGAASDFNAPPPAWRSPSASSNREGGISAPIAREEQDPQGLEPAISGNPLFLAGEEALTMEGSDLHEMVDDMDADDLDAEHAPALELKRITGGVARGATQSATTPHSTQHGDTTLASVPKQRPRWPRDLSWAVAFCMFVPLSLLWPIWMEQVHYSPDFSSSSWVALVHPPLSTATMHALWWGTVATFFLSRWFYRTAPGPDGEEARHALTQVLVGAATACTMISLVLVITVWVWLPHARVAVLLPLWFALHHVVWWMRHVRQSFRGRLFMGERRVHAASLSTAGGVTDSHNADMAYFQALANMALDLLSQSLRRASFLRVLSAILMVQTMVLFLWRWALLGALATIATTNSSLWSWLCFLAALVGGKWATGTVTRLLTLVASGGVLHWALQQPSQWQPRLATDPAHEPSNRSNGADVESNPSSKSNVDMPEAYRTVHADVYQSVMLHVQDLEDDDEEDEDEYFWESNNSSSSNSATQRRNNNTFARPPYTSVRSSPATNSSTPTATSVKALVMSGLTTSFGSVVYCGLVGGVAQLLWSQLRKMDAAKAHSQSLWRAWQRQRERRLQQQGQQRSQDSAEPMSSTSSESIHWPDSSRQGFTSMPIGSSHTTSTATSLWGRLKTVLVDSIWNGGLIGLSRSFVRDHSDWAMAHVAVYYKPYCRAARDVAALVQQAGVEPILEQQDVTTHLCASLGGSLSGLIVLVAAYVLLQEQGSSENSSSSPHKMSDAQIFQDMVLAFVLCYTLIFTVLEPLRASIKAIYVSFAQHPTSLARAYPLIYQRLRRISQDHSTNS